MKTLTLNVMNWSLAVSRLPAGAAVPAWAMQGEFFTISRTLEELSIVCDAAQVPADVRQEGPFSALMVAGPLDFALTGILAKLTAPLAEAGISIFAISTFDTDYVLVRSAQLREAIAALRKAGYTVSDFT